MIIYVSDAGNFNAPPWQVLKFDQNGQNPTVFINNNLNWPQDILFFEDSNVVLVSNLGSGTITKHNASTGAFIANFATAIAGPTRMKIGPDGNLYILQWNGNRKVLRFTVDGTPLGEFTAVGVFQSIGIDWDNNGNLYVSSYSAHTVRKFDTDGADMGLFVSNNLLGPTNIWFDTNGDLLVADYNGTAVKRFDATGNYTGNFIMGLSMSEGVDFLPNGNILIGNGATHSVKMFDSTGFYLQDLIAPGSGNLLNPNAIVVRYSTLSVAENEVVSTAVIFPTVGYDFHISLTFENKIEAIDFYDVTGKLVKVVQLPAINEVINLEGLTAGVYISKIKLTSGKELFQKVIKDSYDYGD
jgi:hypothetical protein